MNRCLRGVSETLNIGVRHVCESDNVFLDIKRSHSHLVGQRFSGNWVFQRRDDDGASDFHTNT